MNTKYLPLFLVFLFFSTSLVAQEKSNDIQLITMTIENYFDGYIHRDLAKLNKAFDTQNGAMKTPSTAKDGTEIFENNYFRDLIPKWANREKLSPNVLENCTLKILTTDIVNGKIGTAKISMSVGGKTYIDILSLQKMNQTWKITNKIYVVLEN